MFWKRRCKFGSDSVQPEARLWWLLYGEMHNLLITESLTDKENKVIPCLPIGLFGFAWTSLGPPRVHWIAPMIFTTIIGIANVRHSCFLFFSFLLILESKSVTNLSTVFYISILNRLHRRSLWCVRSLCHRRQRLLRATSSPELRPCIRPQCMKT